MTRPRPESCSLPADPTTGSRAASATAQPSTPEQYRTEGDGAEPQRQRRSGDQWHGEQRPGVAFVLDPLTVRLRSTVQLGQKEREA
jgi:hypothetical protein